MRPGFVRYLIQHANHDKNKVRIPDVCAPVFLPSI